MLDSQAHARASGPFGHVGFSDLRLRFNLGTQLQGKSPRYVGLME